MSKQTIIKGTMILTITGILTKFLGFYNRIFLTRLIGVKELGTYQLIFPLYILGIAFCAQGIATSVTKHVSYMLGKQDERNAKRVLAFGAGLSFCLGLLISFVLYRFCFFIASNILKNTDCSELLHILSYAIPFVALKACINAYFMGYSKPAYSGTCQLIEQIIRIGSAYLLSISYMQGAINARLAVYAVVIGEIGATVYACICYLLFTRRHPVNKSTRKKRIRKAMLQDIIPITSNNVMFTLFSSLEAIILPAYLFRFYSDNDVAMEMYGIITGIVIPFLLFPSTITSSLSSMLLPSISYASAKKNISAIKKALLSSALFAVLLGLCACIFYGLFGEFLCTFAFKSRDAGTLLRRMGFLCPLIYLSTTLSSIMNGVGLAFQNLLYNIAGISVRILSIVLLVSSAGIPAYIGGMAVSYLLNNILTLVHLYRHLKRGTAYNP